MSRSPDIEDTSKVDNSHIERKVSEDSDDAIINEFSPAEQKKIIRRIDFRLVSILGILYCASLMDRTNLSAASIAGYVRSAYLCKVRAISNYHNT